MSSHFKYKHFTKLTPLQEQVVFQNGTESAFKNEYWDNKKEGIYVDIVDGQPLFSSKDKFDSGSGWPSFTQPMNCDILELVEDLSHGMKRIEVRSSESNIHLGHLFDDGPKHLGGKRYCINSAALKFIPKKHLIQTGYNDYLKLFEDSTNNNTQKAILAGGCFWGLEELFSNLKGVLDVVSGYTGGHFKNPDYQMICLGKSGHAEAIEITFDTQIISYEEILKFFFKIHDPTALNQQGNDVGTQYRSAIFYLDEKQNETANHLIKRINTLSVFNKKIVTTLEPLDIFYKAEEYHQDYLKKNPGAYCAHTVRSDLNF